MKKYFCILNLLLWGNVLAQTFEFFKSNEVEHPTNGLTRLYDSNRRVDSKDRFWKADTLSGNRLLLYSIPDLDTIQRDLAFTFKLGYKYYVQERFIIDEFDSFFINIVGVKSSTSLNIYDNHLVKIDALGEVSYLPQNLDSTVFVTDLGAINNKLLLLLSNSTFIWDNGSPKPIETPNASIRKYKDALYYTGSKFGIDVFYADGTTEKLLPNEEGIGYVFYPAGGMSISTSTGEYVRYDKNLFKVDVPDYQSLNVDWSIWRKVVPFSKNGYNVEVYISDAGFNITQNGGKASSFVFAGKDIFFFNAPKFEHANLQEDSTVMLIYSEDFAKGRLDKLYVFAWKNGVSRFVGSFGMSYPLSSYMYARGYIDGEHVYLYASEAGYMWGRMDDTKAMVNFKSEECPGGFYDFVVDQKYLWIFNHYDSDHPSCSLGRMAHESLMVSVEDGVMSDHKSSYPNPAQDWVQLDKDVETVILYNTWGEEVLQSTETKLGLQGVSNGVYLMKLVHKGGALSTEKLSVQR